MANQDPQLPKAENLTEEEKNIFKECQIESSRRGYSMALGTGLGVFALSRMGIIKNKALLGKIAGASFFAFMVGKASYIPECREKILNKIPDSNLAKSIKSRQSRNRPEDMNFSSVPSESTSPRSESEKPIDFDLEKRGGGYDDSLRPSVDNENPRKDEAQKEVKPFTTYEELRQKNREKQNPQAPRSHPPDGKTKKEKRNMWGDLIEE